MAQKIEELDVDFKALNRDNRFYELTSADQGKKQLSFSVIVTEFDEFNEFKIW